MRLSPSLLSADFGALREQARLVESLAHSFHIDVMDGHFVPNLTIGPPVANSFRQGIGIPLDIHLMIDRPEVYGPKFVVRPDDSLIFHLETAGDVDAVLRSLRSTGCRVGLSLRPATELSLLLPLLDNIDLVLVMSVEPGFGGQAFLEDALPRIATLRREIGSRPVEIAVDGGITAKNVRSVVEAGADTIIAGSAIFSADDPRAAAQALIDAAS